MKHNQMLTDVRLEVATEIFHAHKIVLAAASPYFKGDLAQHSKTPVSYLHSISFQQCLRVVLEKRMLQSSNCKECVQL